MIHTWRVFLLANRRPLRRNMRWSILRELRSTSVLVLRELIAAPFQRGTQTFLLPDLGEFDADVGSCRIERSHDVEPGMHGIGEAHGVGAAVYGELGLRERFRRDQR